MDFLKIIATSKESIYQSFDHIADKLFNDYKLQVNDSFYRLVDIEFFFFADKIHEDVFTHKHDMQLESGKWYFHKSGIDITIGNGTYHGGILLRGILKFLKHSLSQNDIFEKDFHGPVNVKMEISSNLYGAFEDKCNVFNLINVEQERQGAFMKNPSHVVKSKRINLTSKVKDVDDVFLNGAYRYRILLDDFNINYPNKEALIKSLLIDGKMDKSKAKNILGYDVTL
jgi:hypothetical protein